MSQVSLTISLQPVKFSILSGKVSELNEVPEDALPDLLEEIIYSLNTIFGEDAELVNGVNLVFPSENDTEVSIQYGAAGDTMLATFRKDDIANTIGLTE